MRKLVVAALLAAVAATTTGCNTVEGLGKDIQHTAKRARKGFTAVDDTAVTPPTPVQSQVTYGSMEL